MRVDFAVSDGNRTSQDQPKDAQCRKLMTESANNEQYFTFNFLTVAPVQPPWSCVPMSDTTTILNKCVTDTVPVLP